MFFICIKNKKFSCLNSVRHNLSQKKPETMLPFNKTLAGELIKTACKILVCYWWECKVVQPLRRTGQCYGLKVCVSSTLKSWNPTHPCIGIRWGLWEVIMARWDHEDGALVNGISVLIKVMRELTTHLCSLSCEDMRSWQAAILKRFSPEPNHAGILVLDFHPLELRETNFCSVHGILSTEAWTETGKS